MAQAQPALSCGSGLGGIGGVPWQSGEGGGLVCGAKPELNGIGRADTEGRVQRAGEPLRLPGGIRTGKVKDGPRRDGGRGFEPCGEAGFAAGGIGSVIEGKPAGGAAG